MRRSDTLRTSQVLAELKGFAIGAENALLSGASWARRGVITFVRSMQQARMISVLSSFSDEHLAVHGITRDEIPEYAAELLGHKHRDY